MAVLFAAAPASAQQAPGNSEDEQARERARVHFSEGQRLVEQGEYDEAYEEFRKGYELSERPLFLFNMAECARESGDTHKGRRDYERYLEADPDGSMAEMARERLEALPEPEEVPGEAAPRQPAAPSGQRQPPSPEQAAATGAPETPQAGPLEPADTGGQSDRSLWRRWPVWVGIGAAVVVASVVAVATTQSGGGGLNCSGDCAVVDLRE